MQEPAKWIGGWPSAPQWHESGDTLYFRWNPKGAFETDSLFRITMDDTEPVQVLPAERRSLGPTFDGWRHSELVYSARFENKVYEREGEIWIYHRPTATKKRLTFTGTRESDPRFTPKGDAVVFRRENNLFRLHLDGPLVQLSDLRAGDDPEKKKKPDEQDAALEAQQEALFDVLRRRKEERENRERQARLDARAEGRPPTFYVGKKSVEQLTIDPLERYVTFFLAERQPEAKRTAVPAYVTESGYVETLDARPKVGYPPVSLEFYLQDVEQDTTFKLDLRALLELDDSTRALHAYGPFWSEDGVHSVMDIRTWDNRDRWIVALDPRARTLSVLDHQHDDAWLQAPGISSQGGRSTVGWLPDRRTFYFQSEATGWSHLYTVDLETREVRQLTRGDFDVYNPMVSRDGTYWTFLSSEGSPYERHLYRMPIEGGPRTRLTSMPGRNDVARHPREDRLAILHSYTNRPPEIFLQNLEVAKGRDRSAARSGTDRAKEDAGVVDPVRITHSTTGDWEAYPWRDPEIISLPASDGAAVPAQLFIPQNPNGAAVLFVHGAGYLQNVHRWWSSYFREYMFHNLLADEGYVVMNVDFRGSAGYGRDWRTAVYRHMGGRDLQDYVDASRYLQREHGIDPERVFIYGGSYGGFITLMALFTEPEHFGGGAALRAVTDWAHYHHTYTANILTTPMDDSLAFARSSPIHFAEGLEDPLLIAHGMIDRNVHFQDVVRLVQRLIELGKEDWELAVYPLEEHGFEEPESWADEYKRVLKYIRLSVGPEAAAREP